MKPIIISTIVGLSLGSLLPDGRVVGGVEVKPAFKYNFMVSLNKYGEHFCGGTLYSEGTVITAAHCTYDQDKYFEVVIHRHDLTKKEEDEAALRYPVKSRITHPDYVAASYQYDVALWKFQPDPRKKVAPKILLDDGTYTKPNTLLTVAGWGYQRPGGKISDRLMEAKVPIFDTAICAQNQLKLKKDTVYPEVQFCAGYPDGGKDACQSDSGGPLFTVKDKVPVLVGIVSWGNGCAEKDLPGIYTRVSRVANWIRSNA